jgi:hypothetical protein
MPSAAASNLIELLVLITWTCLIAPVHKHGLFAQIFPSQEVLSDILSAAPLTFCPGLFNAILAARPPPLSFFLNLPSDSLGRWGIYALVLEKTDNVPLIYIGSGTEAKRGVRARWSNYDRNHNVPLYVRRALDDGYIIVHKGLLL